jgi:hypothetical protein
MPHSATETNDLVAPPKASGYMTHVSVQIIPLCICALASSALVAATHLPWFGNFGDQSTQPFSAISGDLVPPGSPAGLVPGAQSWGFLLVAWSTMCAVMAVVAACACVVNRHRNPQAVRRFMVGVGFASLVLVALCVSELLVRVPFDEVTLGSDWGAMVGVGLAAVCSFGAWFAWATFTYPRLWGTSRFDE